MFAKVEGVCETSAIMLKRLIIFIFAVAALVCRADDAFTKMFAERAKCAVSVRYVIELEEERRQFVTCGLVADASGLIILPGSEVPEGVRVSALKDFKIFFFEGDVDGYPADYIGCDRISRTHFLKLRKGLPSGLVPVSKFPRAEAAMGQELWGVGIYPEQEMFEPFLRRSYVTDIGRRPLTAGRLAMPVTCVGGPVFDSAGNFVGWGQSEAIFDVIIYIDKGKRAPVGIGCPLDSRAFLFPFELDEILKRIPKNPDGDPRAWLGVSDIQLLKRDVAKILGLQNKCAIVLSDVIKKSPAEAAGLKNGDIIVGMNGKDIERLKSDGSTLANLFVSLSKMNPGDKVQFSVIRGSDAPKTFEAVMGEAPKNFRQSKFQYFKRLGFSVREFLMDDAMARRILETGRDGAVVQFVKPNSPASTALPTALDRNDVIKEINSKPVKTYAEAIEILSAVNADKTAKDLVILAEDFRETKVIRIKLD